MTNNPTQKKIAAAKSAEEKILVVAQYNARRELTALFSEAADSIRRILQGAAGRDGTIPERDLERVTGDAGAVVKNLFVDRSDPRGRRVFGEQNRALSPYAETLNRWVAWSTRQVVKHHHNLIRQSANDKAYRWLATPHPQPLPTSGEGRNPLVREMVVSEQSRSDELMGIAERLRIFSPNPLAQYEPAHTWVDPNGYRLSDRIWRTGEVTRQRLDALIAEGIRQGRSAVEIANLAERFLRPDRRAFRTQKPYGQDGSYDALRLARTEITRANGQAHLVAAKMNPYVWGTVWNLSPSHPKTDICDDNAFMSPYGINDGIPQYPAHPHCLCYLTSRVDDPVSVTEDLMRMMDAARDDLLPYLTPAQIDAFTQQLLGPHLAALGQQAEGIKSAKAGTLDVFLDLRSPTRTINGLVEVDSGHPGNTWESLIRFIEKSRGPLARAMWEGGYVESDWSTDQPLINKAGVQAAARKLVAETLDIRYGRDYLISLAREQAERSGIRNLTDTEAEVLMNRDYAYRARAILEVARIHNITLTEAQYQRLNQVANNGFLDLTYAREGSERGTLSGTTGRGQGYGSGGGSGQDRARAELARQEWLRWFRGE